MRRRCAVSAFLARGAGAAEASSVFLTVLARDTRFFAVASAVIEPAEYASSPLKTQINTGRRASLKRDGHPEGGPSCRRAQSASYIPAGVMGRTRLPSPETVSPWYSHVPQMDQSGLPR